VLACLDPLRHFSVSHHVDTVEVMEAESQALLNLLTGRNFQDAFKNGRITGKCAYAWKWTTSSVMVASISKVIKLFFDQMAAVISNKPLICNPIQ
jgi:ABC-type glycerol-3-phosphate transport system permease component